MAATPQISVQSVRLIGLPSPTAGWCSSRLGALGRVALAVAVLFDLGEVGRVGPGHDGQRRVGDGAQTIGRADGAGEMVLQEDHQERQAVEAEEEAAEPARHPPRLGGQADREAPSETISP